MSAPLGPRLDRLAEALAARAPRRFSRRSWLSRAAVALVLRETAGGVELLLGRRAQAPGDRWSGHLAFPGGLEQPGDADARATAARESLEEAGLDLGRQARYLGALSQLITARHGSVAPLVVAPQVFALVEPVEPVLGPELVSATWVSLDALRRLRAARSRLGRALGWFSPAHGERLGETSLWGLTLAFVDELVGVWAISQTFSLHRK